jgi:hypothetical protein
MADERDRLRKLRELEAATAPARTTPTPVTPASPASFRAKEEADRLAELAAAPVVDEQTRMAVTEPVRTLTPTGAQRAAGTIAQREQRFQEELAAREASKPTEDPGEGNAWVFSVAENRWKKVRVAGGFGGGATAGGGTTGAGGPTGTPSVTETAGAGDATAQLLAQQAAQAAAEEKRRAGQSAYDLLLTQFQQYGLSALVEPLRQFIVDGLSPAEFTLRLRETDAYKKRFAANQARIQKGLSALSEAEYIGLEDQYQDVMRRYGLPENYYSRGDLGRQEGFEKFIGGDVSPVELEDRIQTAQRRVINAAPEVTASLRSFYPEIGQGDLLAYFLDPDKAIENIKRKVTAAEIGGAATMAGLATGVGRAEELARYGVTQEAARQGFQTIAQVLPRGSQLAEIYKQSPYTQTTAEQEVFGLAGAPEAERQRRRLTQLETAAFSGQAGAAGGALGRERAGAI